MKTFIALVLAFGAQQVYAQNISNSLKNIKTKSIPEIKLSDDKEKIISKIVVPKKDKINESAALKMNFGNEGGGGGDICEERIQNIRDDLKKWIQNGGAKALTLPKNISLSEYKDTMLDQISKASIQCVSKGDKGFPVVVDNVPKVCRFDRTQVTSKITCDFEKFLALDEANQYILIHHEYAGLAELEIPNGAVSDYKISSQMTSYLEDRVIKSLVVKPAPSLQKNQEQLQKLEGIEAENARQAFLDYFNEKKIDEGLKCTDPKTGEYRRTESGIGIVYEVMATGDVFRSKDGLRFKFVSIPEYNRRVVLTFSMNASGTKVSKMEWFSEIYMPEGKQNFGSLSKPDYRLTPAHWRSYEASVCDPK